jgi:hypothetical protein
LAQSLIPDYERLLQEYIVEALPDRLVVYGITDSEKMFSFVISKCLPTEDSEACCNRVLRDYFLIPSLFRQLLMQQDDIGVAIFETLNRYLPSNPTNTSQEMETFSKFAALGNTHEKDNKQSNRKQ